MKTLQLIALTFALAGAAFGQGDLTPQEEAARRAKKVAQITGHDEGCECGACGAALSEETDVADIDSADAAAPHSAYELSLKVNVDEFLQNEHIKEMLQNLREDQVLNPEDFLVSKFQDNLNDIMKLQLLEQDLLWLEVNKPGEGKILILSLSAKEHANLENFLREAGKAVVADLQPSTVCNLTLNTSALEELKAAADPTMRKWVGLRFKELKALAEKEGVILILHQLDDKEVDQTLFYPEDLMERLKEEAPVTIIVDIREGYVSSAQPVR